MTFVLDQNLRPYATDRQWQLLSAWESHGSSRKAAFALSVDDRVVTQAKERVLKNAARSGYAPEYDYTRPVPDGFLAKGVSTYYNKEGKPAGQWVKSAIDHERQREIMLAAFEGMKDEIPRFDPVFPSNARFTDDLLAVYPVGDHHHGMLSWDKETDSDWDLKISEDTLTKAMDYLVAGAPPSRQALVIFAGDFLHYDSFETVTPRSKNQLDADSRFPKMVRSGIRIMRGTINAALSKHKHVHVIIEPGNHDPVSSVWFAEMMAVAYESEPRIHIDTTPRNVHYYEFGKVLIGTTHHDRLKMEQLPALMASDMPEAWGRTKHRIWIVGHIHHKKVLRFDMVGVEVEALRVLAPEDAWARGEGYRSRRGMQCIVYHREFGEDERRNIAPERFSMKEAA
jgi:hypothetical protein